MGWAPSYASTGELAAFVRIGDTADDAVLGLALDAASRAIDRATGRQFGKAEAPTARYYTARWVRAGDAELTGRYMAPRTTVGIGGFGGQWLVRIDDLMSQADLEVKVDLAEDQTYSSTITNYQLRPTNAFADGRPWTELWVRPASAVQPTGCPDGVKVTARWGWTTIPDAIVQACLLQASRLLKRRDAPFGIAGSPETGGEVRLLARLDPDVAVAVRPYRRMWGAV